MNTAKVLEFIIAHNTLIIEVLFGVVLIGAIYLAIRLFITDEESSGVANLNGIEESLKKIIESGSKVQSAKSADSKSNEEVSGVASVDQATLEELTALKRENEKLKVDIQNKEAALAEASAHATQSADQAASKKEGGAADVSVTGPLEEKIRDLEGRLAEYAIIEDDIADLSFYKEETVRLQTEVNALKKEIERLKAEIRAGGGVPSPSPVDEKNEISVETKVEAPSQKAASSSNASSTPEPINPEQDAAINEIAAAAAQSSSGETLEFVDNDIMAEFQAAVEAQKAGGTALNTPKPETVPDPAPAPVQPITEPVQSIPDPAPAPEHPTPELAPTENPSSATANESQLDGSFDIDKMMSEANDLSKISESTEDVKNALEEGLDTEKLLSEANLMDDFDKFTKKEKS